ncbi:MAG: hypothetical protein H6887_09615 [Hoeflea sp.]|nr:hypothetical protein [Hoeflea sp.]
MTTAAGHDLAQRDFDTTATSPTFEPGTDIWSIGRACGQVDITKHAAAAAMAGQPVTVLQKIAEGFEIDGVVVGHSGALSHAKSPRL